MRAQCKGTTYVQEFEKEVIESSTQVGFHVVGVCVNDGAGVTGTRA